MSILAFSLHDAIVWLAFTLAIVASFFIVLLDDDNPWLTIVLWLLVIGCAVLAGVR